MSITCATSGVQTVDKVISSSRCKLMSIHVSVTSTNTTATLSTLKIYDNNAASGTEVARINLLASSTAPQNIEFDMHGVLCAKGLYADVDAGDNSAVAYSVEFA